MLRRRKQPSERRPVKRSRRREDRREYQKKQPRDKPHDRPRDGYGDPPERVEIKKKTAERPE